MSRKTLLIVLSGIAHWVVAFILCDLVASIIGQILVLASIGVISGVQSVCISKIIQLTKDSDKPEDDTSAEK